MVYTCLIIQAADSATGGGSSRNEILSRISKMGQPMLPVSTAAVPLPTGTAQDPIMVYIVATSLVFCIVAFGFLLLG